MLGCCGAELEKFRYADKSVDTDRLKQLVQNWQRAGGTTEQIERIKTCDCGCHVDGQCVMC